MATVVISLVSTKGGVGKTTTAANLAGLTAALGLRTLMMDCELRNTALSNYYQLEQVQSTGMAEVITSGGQVYASNISHTVRPNLDIVISNFTYDIESWLSQRSDSLVLLKRALRQPAVRDNYDVVILDTTGAPGLLQKSAAMAADIMISPVKPDVLSYNAFRNETLEMYAEINSMSDMSAELRSGVMCLLINDLDMRTNNSRGIADAIRNEFRANPGVRLLDTFVPSSTIYPSACTMKCPVHEMDRDRNNGRGPYVVMHHILHELMPHLKGVWSDGVPLGESQQQASEGV